MSFTPVFRAHCADVFVDVVDGSVTIKVVDPIAPESEPVAIPLTNDAARLLGRKLLTASELGDCSEVNWVGDIADRAKRYRRNCEEIRDAVDAPSWMSAEVQMIAKAIL